MPPYRTIHEQSMKPVLLNPCVQCTRTKSRGNLVVTRSLSKQKWQTASGCGTRPRGGQKIFWGATPREPHSAGS